MRIIINIDPIREGKKRLRIRTRYQTANKDGREHITVRNAMVDFYGQIVESIKGGIDTTISDFINEGERL